MKIRKFHKSNRALSLFSREQGINQYYEDYADYDPLFFPSRLQRSKQSQHLDLLGDFPPLQTTLARQSPPKNTFYPGKTLSV
ncbi:hypothetical protein N9Y42_05095 [Mariniblastus sp.]|nr:hypothetical protein [Mariniblastus sp.]